MAIGIRIQPEIRTFEEIEVENPNDAGCIGSKIGDGRGYIEAIDLPNGDVLYFNGARETAYQSGSITIADGLIFSGMAIVLGHNHRTGKAKRRPIHTADSLSAVVHCIP